MTETALPITIKTVLSLNIDLWKFFNGGVSVFLAGTTGVGKSSFRLALKRSSLEVIREVTSTTGDNSEEIHYQVNSNTPSTFPLMCYDIGGDDIYRDLRMGVLLKASPLGLIVFVDHRDHRKEIRDALAGKLTKRNVDRYFNEHKQELGKIDPQRMEKHRQYFDEMISLLRANQRLNKYCRVIVPVANKHDLWRDYHTIDSFQEYFRDKLLALEELGHKVAQFMPCSTHEYSGITETMDALLRNSGREWRFFGLKWRMNRPFIK